MSQVLPLFWHIRPCMCALRMFFGVLNKLEVFTLSFGRAIRQLCPKSVYVCHWSGEGEGFLSSRAHSQAHAHRTHTHTLDYNA